MSLFRKKPVVIEAWVIDPNDRTDPPEWVLKAFDDGAIFWVSAVVNKRQPSYLKVVTLEGGMQGSLGDYLIKGIKGELYPCKPDIFALTYEPADTSERPAMPREAS